LQNGLAHIKAAALSNKLDFLRNGNTWIGRLLNALQSHAVGPYQQRAHWKLAGQSHCPAGVTISFAADRQVDSAIIGKVL
jgi:hypothetical protein